MFEFLRLLDYFFGLVLESAVSVFAFRRKRAVAATVTGRKFFCVKLWGLGNLTIIYPLLYKIKEKFPRSEIVFVTFDMNKGFLENNKAIDRIIYLRFTSNIFTILRQFVSLIKTARKERAEILLNFETMNNLSAFFAFLTGPGVKIGISGRRRSAFYDFTVYRDRTKHISETFSGLLRPLGIDSPYRYPDLAVPAAARDRVEKLLSGLAVGRFICIHAGSSENFTERRLGSRRLAELAELIACRIDVPIIFTGTGGENGLIEGILAAIVRKDKLFNLAGKLEKWEFVEMVRRSHLVICNDTWAAHVAASFDKNSVIFYGPNSPRRYGPLSARSAVCYKNLPCSPCMGGQHLHKPCRKHFACMDFDPHKVYATVAGFFEHG
jgi:heptosyltransferase III